jgi:Ca2+-binding EF-hand superfamily protein
MGAANDSSEHAVTLNSVSEAMGIEAETSSGASDVPVVLAPRSTIAEPQKQAISIDLDALRDELTIYHASGQKKHPRFFWLTAQSDGQTQSHLLHWGKKSDGRQAKIEKLLRVIAKPTIPDAERLFYDMDEDDSGYLDAKEVAMLYKKARGEKLSKSNLAKAMREMDSDGNNQVNMDEFQRWWLRHGGDLEQHRDRAFTFVCEGGTEVLVVAKDMETKNRWVSSCAQLLPTAATDNLVSAPSGLLTLYHMTGQKKHSRFFWMNAESKHICWGKTLRSKTCKTEALLRVIDAPTVPDARELFHQVDKDNSGYLDSTEIAALYKKARGERLVGKKLKEAMKVMDSDGNDQVSLTEFEEWWANNGGDLEQHRSRAMTFVCGSGIELLVVAPDTATKRRWVNTCAKLGLLNRVSETGPQDAAPQRGVRTDAMELQQVEDALPVGWETATSQSTGETYYINTLTGDSTYDMPTAPADNLQTDFQVMAPGGHGLASAQTPEEVQQSAKENQQRTADLAKQAEKDLKKLKKEEAKRAKQAAKHKAKEQKAKKKGQAEPPPPDLVALSMDLPSGWETAISRSSGEVYYINTVSGESTYDRPSEPAFTDSILPAAVSEEVGVFRRPLPIST